MSIEESKKFCIKKLQEKGCELMNKDALIDLKERCKVLPGGQWYNAIKDIDIVLKIPKHAKLGIGSWGRVDFLEKHGALIIRPIFETRKYVY